MITVLEAYSRGQITSKAAQEAYGLRDHASLLVALGNHMLPMPKGTPEEIEAEAEVFVKVWNRC